MPTSLPPTTLVTLSTALGHLGLIGRGKVLLRLTFGHSSRAAALKALRPHVPPEAVHGRWNEPLLQRLLAYAAGQMVDFGDVLLDYAGLSTFQRRVVQQCRKIPYGQTWTYGQLAARAGSPRAARAVGNCLAANRFPLIVPCHRVVPAGGGLGGFSAAGGTATKRRLLRLEEAASR